ncbi:hypothetical protein BJX99DRAFT_234945 [Aspergillus californicus]
MRTRMLTSQQQDCATGSIPSECSLIDVECICAERSFIDNMACCVGQSCEAEDQGGMSDLLLTYLRRSSIERLEPCSMKYIELTGRGSFSGHRFCKRNLRWCRNH